MDTGSPHRLVGGHKMVKAGKIIIKSKSTWYNKSGTFNIKKNFEVTDIKLPQFKQSMEVTVNVYLLTYLMVPDMTSYYEDIFRRALDAVQPKISNFLHALSFE